MKAWRWIKAGFIFLGTLAAALFGIRIYRGIVAFLGSVVGPGTSWKPDPEDKRKILIPLPWEGSGIYTPVRLPVGIRPQEIRAVEVGKEGQVIIEVKHEPKDRRGMIRGQP